MPTTPDFLRGQAVAAIVGMMHNLHEGGTWSLESIETIGPATQARMSILRFKVGIIYPETEVDNRQIVEITVEEKTP